MKNLMRNSIVAATVLAGANIAYAASSSDSGSSTAAQTQNPEWDWEEEEGGFIPQKFSSRKSVRRDQDEARSNKAFKTARRKQHHDDYLG